MYIHKNLIRFVLFLSFVSCENLNKPKEDAIISIDDTIRETFYIGFLIKVDTLIRVENQRPVAITAALFDNSNCDPNSTPRYPGFPAVYDFGTVPAKSKSIIKALPLSHYPPNPKDQTGGRLVELYRKVNFFCERTSFYNSNLSNQFGYIWKVIEDPPTFHNADEIRPSTIIPPDME
ncbi:hypothetical protein [Leptospira santarosai]|uniref:hypothetical protein n=1 Tax=Leptospira santarosai TaxID=28183 RepID=UPI0002BE7F31|nr:hypothetical protein [Leptospira santarosai]EMO73441.1 hypothetical protein LEP1GSC130_2622 [Leptospira santarosai str. 200403458]EMP00487.1 hypothetical protein LEP1GSC120_3398 [Leptospira santarosai str. 200702252]MDI7216359.1 hypothetical protein [Leptospira santarosai]